jgi:hypothetical protein
MKKIYKDVFILFSMIRDCEYRPGRYLPECPTHSERARINHFRRLHMEQQDAMAEQHMHMWEEEVPKLPKRKREEDEDEEPDFKVIEVKKAYTDKDEEETHKDDKKIAFLQSRIDDFKLFMERRIPSDNAQAQEKLVLLKEATHTEFARSLKDRIGHFGEYICMVKAFDSMCGSFGIKETDFVDRSLERPDVLSEAGKQKVLQNEVMHFKTQMKELVDLIKDIPDKFWEVLPEEEKSL